MLFLLNAIAISGGIGIYFSSDILNNQLMNAAEHKIMEKKKQNILSSHSIVF